MYMLFMHAWFSKFVRKLKVFDSIHGAENKRNHMYCVLYLTLCYALL
jgi:hypothetical protein